nr:VCBS repeat-containing protein [Blastocatellia bacterium]
VVTNNLDPSRDTILTALALQADGKIVATGFSSLTQPSQPPLPQAVIVARYNDDGSLDNSFDGDGKIFIFADGASSRAHAVTTQSDGKIVVGGTRLSGTSDIVILRLNGDGSFDTSFDGDGTVTTTIAATSSSVAALSLQPDGRIIAAGTSGAGSSRDIAVVRYSGDGSLDTTFDMDGIVLTHVGDDVAASARIQPDGRILVGGHTIVIPGTRSEFLALRYNTDGMLDSSFDGDGKVITRVGTPGTNRSSSLLLQSDGRIVLAGSLLDSFTGDFALVRYNADGTLDGGFDGDGKALLELGNAGDSVYSTAVQPDGKIVCVGYVFSGWFYQPAVARFNQDGTPDVTFGNQGSVTYPTPNPLRSIYANDVAIQSDGKIVFSIFAEEAGGFPYTVVRLNADGSYDSSFGTGGTVTLHVGTWRDQPAGLEVQADGKVIVGGTSGSDAGSGPSIIRLNTNGTPDASFGMGGKVFTTDAVVSGSVYAVTLQPDGKIILAGSGFFSNDYTFFTTRYNTNGTIDSSFGGTGAVNTAIGSAVDGARTVAVQPDGKVVVGGFSRPGAAAVRYNSNGTLDETFGGDGIITIAGNSALYPWIDEAVIQSNGKIVFVGSERMPIGTFGIEKYSAALFRFNADGLPDPSFGINGRVVSTIGDHNSSYSAVSLLPNGMIVAGGTSSNGLNDDFTVVRYLGDYEGGNRTPFDLDGDGKTDLGIFRPSVGEWWINRSSDGQVAAFQFGAATDRIVPADYTGDGKTDIAFFRPSSGEWYILRSENNSFFSFPFGSSDDIPAPADYDADGKADPAVFRPSTATWYIQRSSDNGTTIAQFGATGDQPVTADYDGDGKADLAIYRPSNGQWWLNRSTAGVIVYAFGDANDKAVQGDYTGDGKSDVAFWRPSTGEWYILRSEDSSYYSAPFGTSGDIPAPGDYDGDGKFDTTVFRPSNANWYSQRTTAGTLIQQFGSTGDRPIPNAFVP